MRLAGLVLSLVLVAGGGLFAFAYPALVADMAGREIGRWTLYSADGGFKERTATLAPADGKTELHAAIRLARAVPAGARKAVVSLDATDESGTVLLSRALGVAGPGRLESPQTGIVVYSLDIGTLEPKQGDVRLVATPGPDFSDDLLGIELFLAAERVGPWPYARSVGIGVMVLGAIGVLGSLRRRRENPNSSPPRQNWGRR